MAGRKQQKRGLELVDYDGSPIATVVAKGPNKAGAEGVKGIQLQDFHFPAIKSPRDAASGAKS